MKKNIFIIAFTIVLTVTAFAQQSFNIGDTGPAGGFIFYDKGDYTDGWRYLEAAPLETEFYSEWGTTPSPGATGISIGTGKQNTQKMLEIRNQVPSAYRIAQMCNLITLNGYSDWYLPSIDELLLNGRIYADNKFHPLRVRAIRSF